ncbi:MAG: recombinase family protein [Dethiobacter sp.]|nr:recombinase family protein [Dethiobacter sp.]
MLSRNVARHGFQKLIFDCYESRIDIVLVKTISRFARNTVVCSKQ